MESRDIVIVGGGPAGAGTALHLERIAPALAARCLVLDRAVFPRDKTCAGGLIPHTLDLLAELGLSLDVPHVRVDHARVDTGGRPVEIDQQGCCWVIRRREFDDMLVRAARERGVEVRCGVKVSEVRRDGEGFLLETSEGAIRARAVVGADGSGSLVRRRLVDAGEGWVARATMADVPTGEDRPADVFAFDFRPVRDGLAGYAWSFPCVVDGRPHRNVGVYSIRREGEGERIGRLVDELAGAPGIRHRAAPIRLHAPGGALGAPGVLLVGDAAGVEALLGEGISFALEHARIAARTLAEGFAAGDLAFVGYAEAVRRSRAGRKLDRLALLARLFYGRWSRLWFFLARLSGRAQRVGMDWYNGVGKFGGGAPASGWQGGVAPSPRERRSSWQRQ